jgi:hypothetical protein
MEFKRWGMPPVRYDWTSLPGLTMNLVIPNAHLEVINAHKNHRRMARARTPEIYDHMERKGQVGEIEQA